MPDNLEQKLPEHVLSPGELQQPVELKTPESLEGWIPTLSDQEAGENKAEAISTGNTTVVLPVEASIEAMAGAAPHKTPQARELENMLANDVLLAHNIKLEDSSDNLENVLNLSQTLEQ
jgi:hypothetical protein